VHVDGKRITDLASKFSREVEIAVDGKKAIRKGRELYLFHKPRGVITTMNDPQGRRCIADFVRKMPSRVFPVGRLDNDVCGLLLLTNDGDFAEALLHPRYGIEREYVARVKGIVTDRSLGFLKHGIAIEGQLLKALWAERLSGSKSLEALIGIPEEEQSLIRVTVAEGSKHFVKKLLLAAGHPVVRLARIRFGRYALGELSPGEIRKIRLPKAGKSE